MSDLRFNVLISRPPEKLESVLKVLPSNRFNVHGCPTVDIHSNEAEASLGDIFSQIHMFDYMIFTSQYAVIETFERLQAKGIKPKHLDTIKICAVGPMVSQALSTYGYIAHMIPQHYTAQSLAELFSIVRSGALNVFLPRGNRSPQVLGGMLSKKGYVVVSPVLYTTELRNSLDTLSQTMIKSHKVDCFAFTSPSSVIALMSMLTTHLGIDALKNVAISAIGPSTYKACQDAGLKVDIMSNEYTVQGMARAITGFFSKYYIKHH